MKPEVKQQWIEALLSGDYKQTKQALQNEEGYCCLGVLCDIYSKEHSLDWGEYLEFDDGAIDYSPYVFLGCEELPPEVVVEWAGLECEDPVVMVEAPTSLSKLNDNGYDFKQISKLIKDQL